MSWKSKNKYNPKIPKKNVWTPPEFSEKVDANAEAVIADAAKAKEKAKESDSKPNNFGLDVGTVYHNPCYETSLIGFYGKGEEKKLQSPIFVTHKGIFIGTAWSEDHETKWEWPVIKETERQREAQELNLLSRSLPGINEVVHPPCGCPSYGRPQLVRRIIIHLNDDHTPKNESLDIVDKAWTREDIADWLDKLHDDGKINIEFEPWAQETTLETLGVENEDS